MQRDEMAIFYIPPSIIISVPVQIVSLFTQPVISVEQLFLLTEGVLMLQRDWRGGC